MTKQKQKANKQPEVVRPVDRYLKEMDQTFAKGSKSAYAILLSLAFFGIMGLIWMIPFPQFDFLVNMNAHTFLNWGSLFIAIVIYSYLRLAPTLSYAVLFCIAIMSFFIVQLEYVERDGGPTVILVCSVIAIASLGGLILLLKKEGDLGLKHLFKLLGLGPVWLWAKVFDKFKWKY